jgi:hypothetical protein
MTQTFAEAHTERRFDAPRSYLFVTAGERPAAAEAMRFWADGPPDLCITSPSEEATDTAEFLLAGAYVPMMSEPLLEACRPWESWDDFTCRFAMGLRIVAAYDTRAALVVCDEVPDGRPTPFALDGESILGRAALLESAVPLP